MGLIYETSLWDFVFLSVILGGGAAWLTGRALAITWRPYWQVLVYMVLLTGAVRFLHFALFEDTLLSLHFYLVDLVILAVSASLGFRWTRAWQMATQYPWLYRRTSPFTWRDRAPREDIP